MPGSSFPSFTQWTILAMRLSNLLAKGYGMFSRMAERAKAKIKEGGKSGTKRAKPSGTPRKRRGVRRRPRERGAPELLLAEPPPELAELAAAVREDGGAVLATYREPLGGHALMLAALPVDKVAPTPFQRDISDAHV